MRQSALISPTSASESSRLFSIAAAVLPDTALSGLKVAQFHRIALPDRFTLCLAWSARNADTRPALAGLIEQITEKMAFVV